MEKFGRFFEPAGFCGASKAGVALATGAAEGAVTVGRERSAFASTVCVERVNTTAANAIEEAPASSHIRSGFFRLMMLCFRRFTIRPFY